MTTHFTLSLPFATPSQNTYQRWHWGRQAKFKATCQILLRVRLNELGLFGNPRPDCRVKIMIARHSSKRLDRGNFIGGCKPLLDALRDECVIRDDDERWLDDDYEQVNAARGKQRTVIDVEHIDVTR